VTAVVPRLVLVGVVGGERRRVERPGEELGRVGELEVDPRVEFLFQGVRPQIGQRVVVLTGAGNGCQERWVAVCVVPSGARQRELDAEREGVAPLLVLERALVGIDRADVLARRREAVRRVNGVDEGFLATPARPRDALAVGGERPGRLPAFRSLERVLRDLAGSTAVFNLGSGMVLAVIVLRVRRPDWPRPFRAPGYPFLPLLYAAAGTALIAILLKGNPKTTWPGYAIVLAGVPVYFLWKRRAPSDQ